MFRCRKPGSPPAIPMQTSISTTTAINPHFRYLDEHNLDHDIWFLDAVTAFNEMRAAQNLGIQTFALWRLGAEDRSLWKVWDVPGEPDAPDKLKDVPPGQDVDMEGQGEILRIEARPADGDRDLTMDPIHELITDENFRCPCPSPIASAVTATVLQSRAHFRRWPRSRLDAKNSRRAQARTRARDFFPHRYSGRQVWRPRQAHLERRPRNRQSHLHPPRHQQHFRPLHEAGTEPH